MVKKKFGDNSDATNAIDKLQAKPDSPARRETVAEELKAANAAGDPELLRAAQSLLELIKALPQGERYVQQVAQGTGIVQASEGSTATVTIARPSTLPYNALPTTLVWRLASAPRGRTTG